MAEMEPIANFNLAIQYAKIGDVNNVTFNLNKAIQIDERYYDYAKEEKVFEDICHREILK